MMLFRREVLADTPDNYRYHTPLREALGLPGDSTAALDAEQRGRLRELYAQLQAEHPRSSAAFRIPLDFEVGVVHGIASGRLRVAVGSRCE